MLCPLLLIQCQPKELAGTDRSRYSVRRRGENYKVGTYKPILNSTPQRHRFPKRRTTHVARAKNLHDTKREGRAKHLTFKFQKCVFYLYMYLQSPLLQNTSLRPTNGTVPLEQKWCDFRTKIKARRACPGHSKWCSSSSDSSGGAKPAKHIPGDASRVPVRALLHVRTVLGGVPVVGGVGGLPKSQAREKRGVVCHKPDVSPRSRWRTDTAKPGHSRKGLGLGLGIGRRGTLLGHVVWHHPSGRGHGKTALLRNRHS